VCEGVEDEAKTNRFAITKFHNKFNRNSKVGTPVNIQLRVRLYIFNCKKVVL
jgi:hypothetical protein